MGEEGSGGILGVSRKRIDFYKSAIFLNKQFKLFAEKKKLCLIEIVCRWLVSEKELTDPGAANLYRINWDKYFMRTSFKKRYHLVTLTASHNLRKQKMGRGGVEIGLYRWFGCVVVNYRCINW